MVSVSYEWPLWEGESDSSTHNNSAFVAARNKKKPQKRNEMKPDVGAS